MKKLSIIVLFTAILFGFSRNGIRKGLNFSGTYLWQYTMEEGKLMLIKSNDSTEIESSNHIQFLPKYRFEDKRSPMCGNDITYNKKGRYYISFKRKKLILNYLEGSFSDYVGGDTKQVYVKGRVYYTITGRNADTIFLKWRNGSSQKKVSRN